MIAPIWDSSTSYLNGAQSATPVGRIIITNTAAETGVLLQQIDMSRVQNVGDVASVEVELITNNVAPNAGESVTAYAAFSSSGSKQPPELAGAATIQACPLPQVAGRRQTFFLPLLQTMARYLYIWFDHSTLPAGATVEIHLIVNGKRN
jgi:hypothetical protein